MADSPWFSSADAAEVAIAAIATLLALDEESKVMGLVSYAWAGFGPP